MKFITDENIGFEVIEPLRDLDFGELVYVNKLTHSGVILLRLKKDSSKNKLIILKSLFRTRLEELEKAFTVVTESKVRIKKDEVKQKD